MNENSTECKNFVCTTSGLITIMVPTGLFLVLIIIIIYMKRKKIKCLQSTRLRDCIKSNSKTRKSNKILPSFPNDSVISDKSPSGFEGSMETKANINEKDNTDLDQSVHHDLSFTLQQNDNKIKQIDALVVPIFPCLEINEINRSIEINAPIPEEILEKHEEFTNIVPEITFRKNNKVEEINLDNHSEERTHTKGTDVELRMNTYLKSEFSDCGSETLSNHESQRSEINITNEMLYGDKSPQETVRVISELTSTSLGYIEGDTPRKATMPNTARSSQIVLSNSNSVRNI